VRKIVDLNDGQMLERGIFPSLAENQVELWRECSNVEFQSRRAKKATGFSLDNNSGTIYAIAQAFVTGNQRAYFATASDLWYYQAGLSVNIGTGFDISGFWSLETWGNFLLATNEVDPPKVWKNTGLAENLAGFTGVRLDRRYRLFKKFKNHMLGFFGQQVDWSSESNIELWVPDTNNSAGGLFLRDLDSDIIAACPLGPDFAIYAGDSMSIMRYTGSPFYFGVEPAIDGIGAVSDSAIVAVGNRNYGLSLKGFFSTDGVGFDYIDNPQINSWFKARFYAPQARRTVGVHDEENETVKWFFLGEAGMIYGVGFNYKKNSWTILDQAITAAAPKQVFATALIGTRAGFGFMTGFNLDTAPMSTSLLTYPLDGGDREMFKLWDLYRTDFEGGGLEVRFGFQDELKSAIEWTDWEPLTYENWINRESVFLNIELRSTELDSTWALTGFSVHGEKTAYL